MQTTYDRQQVPDYGAKANQAEKLIDQCERAARAVSGGDLNKDAFIGALTAQIKMLVGERVAPSPIADEHETSIPFGKAIALARYTYEAGESRTTSHPGASSEAHLTGLYIGGADVMDALNGSQISAIESGLLEQHEYGMPLAMRKAA